MDILKKRYVYVAIGFLMMLVLGVGYAWSIFVGPLQNTFHWTVAQTSLAFTMLLIAYSCGCIVTGILSRRMRYKNIVRLAAVFMGGGMFLTSLADNIIMLYVTYSVCVGLAIGMVYNTVISILPRWFPEKEGGITGLLLMGYALSTSIFGPLCQRLLANLGVQSTFVILAVIDFAVLAIGSFFMHTPMPEEQAKLPAPLAAKQRRSSASDKTPRDMLRSKVFYLYFCLVTFLVMISLAYLNHVAPALETGLAVSAATAAVVVSAMSLCNGFARPLFGIIYDHIGMRATLLIVVSIYLSMSWITWLGMQSGSVPVSIVGACGLLFGYGAQGAIIPSITRELFGEKYFSLNYSIMSLFGITGSVGPSIAGLLQTSSGSYTFAFLVLAVMMVAPFVLALFIRPSEA